MAKTDAIVSMAGSFQTTASSLDTAVRKQGGTLSEALVLLGAPEYEDDLNSVASILASLCKKRQAALEAAERVKIINKTTIMVNLASAPRLPFDGTTVEHNAGGGWVRVERKKDGLYVDGKKVLLHLVDAQKGGTIRGHELRDALSGKPVLHPNILDALYDNPHLIPEEWKQDEQSRTRYIFFWAVIYRNRDGDLYVRYLFWRDGAWQRSYSWLGDGFGIQDPAAVSAS